MRTTASDVELEPYKPPVCLEHALDTANPSVIGVALRAITRPRIACFIGLLYVGFIATPQLLACARPVRGWLIAGLACQRGWREAVHELSCIASLYPVLMTVCVVLGLLRFPRTWLYGTAMIMIGFTANLVWAACLGALPGGIESVTRPPGPMRVLAASLHGLAHVCLIPIGFRIGHHLRGLSHPPIRRLDYIFVALLLTVWAFAIFEPKTSLQHAWIRAMTFATLLIYAVKSTSPLAVMGTSSADSRDRVREMNETNASPGATGVGQVGA
ncbi:MAG: hypothetical protein AAFU85_24130 [Planctomycetota bacterium]